MRALLPALLLAACAAAHAQDVPAPADAPATAQSLQDEGRQQGHASWYGLALHGRRTASGERFDMNALTAAHPTLPFGTLVEVRSLRNGRTVTVRINDRGPHTGDRIIDLSHAAARKLGLLGIGTKPVEIRPVGRGAAR